MNLRAAGLLVALGPAALACAGSSGGYLAGLAEGDRAYRSGRFGAAASAYERAAALAE
ncbi:MAG: hypothetical protein JWM10_4089, partial [Myxococcaceae bacterium]|nr:hypothetical protein [Myxococcaceae bacterium]